MPENGAVTVTGTTDRVETVNGPVHFHHLRFAELEPDTAYAYRLRGSAGWSEWHQFRTAADSFKPFRFLYFGDVQTSILAQSARVIRQAYRSGGAVDLAVHAGDLVSRSGDLEIDDGWGEWGQAGNYNLAETPQLPAIGNHEYVTEPTGEGAPSYRLGSHWPVQFTLPGNGAAAAPETTYFVDYQGVRFIVLDATSALHLGTAKEQAAWLKQSLSATTALWKIVVFHQPMFSCARPTDNELLIAAWRPVLEEFGADLVLQGHDHCYSRVSGSGDREAIAANREAGSRNGVVYVVSVAGAKMNPLDGTSVARADRSGEAVQLFQLIDVAEDRLSFRAFTATGRLFDSFDLVRGEDGTKVMHDHAITASR